MVERSDEEKKRLREAYRRSVTGPMGPQGPMGGVSRTTGTVSTPTPKSTFRKIKDAAYGLLPQGAYGTSQTVGPLATQMNPVPSLKRTFTGENFRGYANPNSGWDWKRRGIGVAEDALNLFGAAKLARMSADAVIPKYDYGIHVSTFPRINEVTSGKLTNMGGVAGDAMENSSYFWRLSPHPVDAGTRWTNQELQDSAARWAQYWVDKMPNLTMYDDGVQPTAYLTRTRRTKNIVPDENFLYDETGAPWWSQSEDGPLPSLVATNNQPLKVIDKTYGLSGRPDVEPGSFEAFNYVTNVGNGVPGWNWRDVRPMNQAMQNDVSTMIQEYARKIARNNARIRRGMR